MVLFVHTLIHSVECDKLHSCNLPNELSCYLTYNLGGNKDVNMLAESVYNWPVPTSSMVRVFVFHPQI